MLYKILILSIISNVALTVFAQSGSWRFYNTNNSPLPSNYVRSFAQEGDSIIWVGTGGGAARFDGTKWTTYTNINSGIPPGEVRAIAIDGQNKWFGILFGGVAKYNDTAWTVYNTSNSGLPLNTVLCLDIDNGGNIWVGTASNPPAYTLGGATRFNKLNSWTNYNTFNSGIADLNIRTINAQDTNHIWFGTLNGLSKKIGNNWTTYRTVNSPLPYDDVRSVKIDSLDNLWIGTYGGEGVEGGITKFDGTNWTVYGSSNSSLLSNSVGTICIDHCYNIWCGNYFLHRFGGTSWTMFDTSNSPLPDYNIAEIFEDKQGNIWIGTTNEGIAVFKNDCPPVSTSISSLNENSSTLFPNPFSNNLTVTLSENKEFTVLFYNLLGQQIMYRTFTKSTTLSTEHLPRGTYFYVIRSSSGILKTGNIINH